MPWSMPTPVNAPGTRITSERPEPRRCAASDATKPPVGQPARGDRLGVPHCSERRCGHGEKARDHIETERQHQISDRRLAGARQNGITVLSVAGVVEFKSFVGAAAVRRGT